MRQAFHTPSLWRTCSPSFPIPQETNQSRVRTSPHTAARPVNRWKHNPIRVTQQTHALNSSVTGASGKNVLAVSTPNDGSSTVYGYTSTVITTVFGPRRPGALCGTTLGDRPVDHGSTDSSIREVNLPLFGGSSFDPLPYVEDGRYGKAHPDQSCYSCYFLGPCFGLFFS